MRALLIIDVQNDFCPGGALPVPEGDQIVPVINHLQEKFDLVAASQDWHPKNHVSFASNHPGKKPGDIITVDGIEQILWPDHCVQETWGARLHPSLQTEKIAFVIQKGRNPNRDAYSAFFNVGEKPSVLHRYLKEKGIAEIHLAGLALNVCVQFSALDAAKLGYQTTVLLNACRGVNLKPSDVETAIQEMKTKGISVV